MTFIESLPLDFTRSPYTGWTRDHWSKLFARVTYGYVLAAERQGSMARALYPHDYRPMPDDVDAVESFARIASAWGLWLSNPNNPAELEFEGRTLNLEEILKAALLDGTNRQNSYTYWGDVHDMDQRIVESADIAITLWFSRERVFNRLSESERTQIINWLAQMDSHSTYYDNWILFPVLPMAVRLHLGYPVDVELLDARLDQIEAFYRGDGWYIDGPYAEFELYNAWMFGWHYLWWAQIDGARRPDYTTRVLRRARSFLAGFQHFFGANGSYPAWGRSLVYRFSAVACFVTGYELGITSDSPGAVRRLLSGNLKYFYDHAFIDPTEHYIRQGYHGDFPPAGEAYISPGSPCWACHAFGVLRFDADAPLWTETEESLPVERGDYDLTLPAPGFVVSGRRNSGQVLLLNAGSGHLPENPRHNYVSKYGKLVYATHFPFNLLPAPKSYAPDAMIALTEDDRTFSHRFMSRAHQVAPGLAWSEFVAEAGDDPQLVRVAVLLWRDVQLRFTSVLTSHTVRVLEAPGALGAAGAASVTRRSDAAQGWEYAEAEGRALAIRRLYGYDAQRPSAPFLQFGNINLAYPYAEQPIVTEQEMRLGTRHFATASLLRPAPFDPAQELADIAITVMPDGSFEAQLPDGSAVFCTNANRLPQQVTLGALNATGEGIRALLVSQDGSYIMAAGVNTIASICELERTGTIRLQRIAFNTVHVTTNVGVRLNADWLSVAPANPPLTGLAVQGAEGSWVELETERAEPVISRAVVNEWSERIERAYLKFRVNF